MKRYVGLLLLLVLVTGACSRTGNDPKTTGADPVVAEGMNPAMQANNVFAGDLYTQLAESRNGENLFFSPYSISAALFMTAEGARGETAVEMAAVLGVPGEARLDLDPVHAGHAGLSDRLERADQYELNIANALWGERTCALRADYLETIDRYYRTGGVFPVDFVNDFSAVRIRINAWVEQQTAGLIADLLPRGAVDPSTRLVLTNAIHFLGRWAEPFPEERTDPDDFFLADGSSRTVPLMRAGGLELAAYAAFNADGSFFETPHELPIDPSELTTYPAADGFAMVELPYMGGDLSMLLIAPNRHDGLPGIEARLADGGLDPCIARLESRTIHVAMPRFELENSYGLVEPLRALGMTRAFRDPGLVSDGADFSGMIDVERSGDRLFISDVIHKAFVEVNEKGTEAAAATAVVMGETSAAIGTIPFIPEFRADRPFLFLIRDRVSGCILFMGRFVRPE